MISLVVLDAFLNAVFREKEDKHSRANITGESLVERGNANEFGK